VALAAGHKQAVLGILHSVNNYSASCVVFSESPQTCAAATCAVRCGALRRAHVMLETTHYSQQCVPSWPILRCSAMTVRLCRTSV